MSDFSAFSLFTAGLACLIPFTAAYTQPTGNAPKGNPISQPGLQSIVPVGKGFAITWQPTTQGTVTLVLLKGPSSNAVPQYAIVEKTPNDGEYIWTPKTDLVPTDTAQGYGIQLIDDATGQYQYTTQFGIANPGYKDTSSSSETPSKTPPSYGSSTAAPVYSSSTKMPPSYSSSTKPYASAPPVYTSTKKPANVTMVAPTAYYTPTTIATSAAAPTYAGNASASASPSTVGSTGGAATLATSFIGLVLTAGVAFFTL